MQETASRETKFEKKFPGGGHAPGPPQMFASSSLVLAPTVLKESIVLQKGLESLFTRNKHENTIVCGWGGGAPIYGQYGNMPLEKVS